MSKSCRTLCAVIALAASTVFATQFGDIPVSQVIGNLSVTSDSNVTLTLGGTPTDALLKAASITAGWSGQLSIARGGTGANLSDPGANRLMGWDDTDNAIGWFTIGTNLTYDHATHTLSATGGGVSTVSIGNSLFVDAVNGNDGTGTRGRLDKPFLTISGAIAAAGITTGDVIYVGPGTFTENSGIELPSGVSIVGSGINETIIESSIDSSFAGANKAIVKPGSNALISDLSIRGTASGVWQDAIGVKAGSTNGWTGTVVVNHVHTVVNVHGIVVEAFDAGHSVGDMEVYDCRFDSKSDDVEWGVSVAGMVGTLRLFNCELVMTTVGYLNPGNSHTGIDMGNATAQMFGGRISATGAYYSNRCVYAGESDTLVELYGVSLERDASGAGGGTSSDLEQFSGTLRIADVARRDGAALTKLGTITNISRDLIRDNNLSDIVNAGTARTNLGLAIGTNVQAWDTQLDSLAGLSYTGNANKVVSVNLAETGFELTTPTTGVTTFLALTDTDPTTYSGQAGKLVRVNAGETGLEFTSPSGGGNVSNTGTPVDNQIPVWTNATTIEGTTGLTYTGTAFTVSGDPGGAGRLSINWNNTNAGANTSSQFSWLHNGAHVWSIANDSTMNGAQDIQIYDNVNSRSKFFVTPTRVSIDNTALFGWGGSGAENAQDTALTRNTAGVVEINNGTAGQYRDVLARDYKLPAVDGHGLLWAGGQALISNGGGSQLVIAIASAPMMDIHSSSANVGRINIGSGSRFTWDSNADPANLTTDTGLGRNAAGVVEINNGTNGTYRDLIVRNITLQSSGVITGSGTVPTGGTSNQVLQKNSNTNYDVGWTTLAGGGNVSNSGTPTSGQTAVWTDATHIKGETSLAGGTTSQVLKKNSNTDYDYSWGAGGGGTPGGSNTQVQFNNSGAFGGDSQFTWNGTTHLLYDATPITGKTLVQIRAGAANGAVGGTDPILNFLNPSGTQVAFVRGDGVISSSLFDTQDDATAAIDQTNTPIGIKLKNSANISWSVGAQWWNGGFDLSLTRNAAGVLEINNGTAGQYRDLYARNITLQSSGIITGNGTVPTGGTTNQVLQKNSNTNYDVGWTTAAGGGNVSNTGTPVNDQIAVWTDATHVEGTAALTQNSNGLINETYSDAGTGNQATGLALTHMTSSTATTDFGVGIGFNAENSAGAGIAQGVLETAWSNATNLSETSYMIFGLSNLGSPVFVAKMFGNGSLSVGGTTADPGAGYINANTGLKIGGTDIFPVTTARGGVPTGGTISQVLQKNSNSNYDVGWTTLTGGGNVSNSGTPTVGQYARWTDATHVEGVAASTVKSDLSLTASDVGLGSVTNDAQTKAAVVPNTAPTSGQILIGNAGNTAYAKQSVSGSGATISLNDTGVISISAIANTSLSNSSITIAGTSTSLGGTITRDTITGVSSNGVVKRTGANTYSNLVDTTVGDNLLTLTNPSAITFLKVNADNTVTAEGASTFRTSLGATTVGSNVFTLGTPAGNSYVTVAANNSVSYTTAPSGTLVGTSDTQTLTNKRVNPRTNSTASATSWTPASDSYDEEIQTALAGDLTINAPSGTPVQGQKLILRITSNGSSHNVSVTTGSAGAFRALGVTLPTTIAASKTIYMGCIYNTDASRWDVVAVATEA